LIVAELTGFDYDKSLTIGSVAEIAWTGIIIHDDIIDHDVLRRGRTCAHIKFTINSALCAGQLALTQGTIILGNNSLKGEIAAYCEAVSKTYQGQVSHQRITKTSTEAELYSIYRLKTSLGVWAITAAAPDAYKSCLTHFCTILGEAGQIKDDLDDLFIDSPDEVIMRDLRQGIYSSPWILFYQRATRNDAAFVDAYFGNQGTVAPRADILRKLCSYGVIDTLIEQSQQRISDALHLLTALPDADGRVILGEWAESHSVRHYKQ